MKRKDGRPFEKLVSIIQEAIKDSDATEVLVNHKIPDRTKSGKDREFDVFITAKVSGIDIKIAIECKDYNKPVSLEKVEAFNSKCSSVPGINKKIMISPKGFQSGATENAKDLYDIDLYQLESVNTNSVENWLDINRLTRLQGTIEIAGLWVQLEGAAWIEVGSTELDFKAKVTTDDGQIASLSNIAVETFKCNEDEMGFDFSVEAYKISQAQQQGNVSLYGLLDIEHDERKMWLTDTNGKKHEITAMKFLVEYKVQLDSPKHIEVRQYSQQGKPAHVNLVTATYSDQGDKIQLVRENESEEMTAFFVDKEGNVEKMTNQINVDLSTGKII